MALITFDAGTTLDRLRLVRNNPYAISASMMLPEMCIALTDSQSDARRSYAAGYVAGVMAGLGFTTATAVRAAETVLYALPLSYDNLWRRRGAMFERTADPSRVLAVCEASGVLYGYKESTYTVPDALECTVCERRVIRDLDETVLCPDGVFCGDPDCYRSFTHGRDCRED